MNLAERLRQAMQKDVEEMELIYEAAAAGNDPAKACSQVVGGSFQLSKAAAAAIQKEGGRPNA